MTAHQLSYQIGIFLANFFNPIELLPRAVLDGALAVAGLADTDVAKAMLVQKAMTATGVTPEVMAQGGIHI